ncbi:hypothetical protein [Klebsiella sp. WP4-W18-ESBL-05]|uniref:hypothetical protein n=1 Tax=Klebsiella sp. WP4-W18-ESBL-05 TaxID=2675713 RepID=UPI0015DD4348|nr:hypothetical protein [Klebsiella sp. WP4-W18-ESBL-05]BBR58925.1 hypothetical protein WP4W18E05_22930 [Klebsiella sp. WP4-W18-ESBL-05]
MSENNYGSLMMKLTVGVSDDINAILSPGIYPIPPANASSPDSLGGVLILPSGSPARRFFISDSIIFLTSTRNGDKWTSWRGPLSRINPFADIKADGTAAIAEALSNLQLRESFSGVVGTSLNARMSISAAAATATFTADELIVEAATGQQYRLSAFNKTVNLGAVGAGGMDAGTVPASGFVALYAIFNPTTNTSALLAVDATSINAPELYGGANMPAGYTASALVSVWRVSGSQFVAGYQTGRSVSFPRQIALTSTSQITSLTALSIAGIVPKNATDISGYGSLYSTAATGGLIIDVASGASGAGIISIGGYVGNTGLGVYGQFSSLALVTPQTMYYDINPNGSVVQSWSASIVISRYSI